MKKLLILCLLSCGILLGYSQKFTVPKIQDGIEKSEYVNYEKEFLSCMDWLENYGPTSKLRKDVNAYALWWISGTPDIKMELNTDIVNLKDPNMLLLFLGGWAKAAIENEYNLSTVDGNLAGLRTVMNYYKKFRNDLTPDKNIDKYIKMEKNGTLESHIQSVVK